MRARVVAWLRALADSLDVTTTHHLIIPRDALYRRAQTLTEDWDERLGAGFGEAKRHQVYAQLLKEFPESKRAIARVIEAVLV